MKTMVFTPTICKQQEGGETPKYTGTVTLTILNSSEKLEILEQIGIQVDDGGNVRASEGNFTTTAKMIRASEKFYQAVEIKRTSDGEVLKTFEDIHYENGLLPMLIEVAQKIFEGGLTVTKN